MPNVSMEVEQLQFSSNICMFLMQLKLHLSYELVVFTCEDLSKINEIKMPQNLHTKVFKAGLSLIVNSCSMKKMSTDRRMDKKRGIYSYNKIVFSNIIHACNNMDGSPKHHVEWKNSESKQYYCITWCLNMGKLISYTAHIQNSIF